jgi:hypothetical protein
MEIKLLGKEIRRKQARGRRTTSDALRISCEHQ